MLHALGAGHALHDDLAVLVQEDAHGVQAPAFASSAALSAASSIVSTSVTSGWFASVEDAASLDDVVAVEAHDQRLVRLVAEHAQRGDDAVGDRVARGDAAEDVDEHRAHRRVVEDDVQPVGHDLGARAAADVEEVGGLDAAVPLAGVGDDVERRHDQARAVADDADLALELDVVEVLLLGLLLERVGRLLVLELGVARLPEVGVVVEGDLAVERDDAAVADPRQRVDLDQRGVLLDEGLPELDQDVGDGRDQVLGELAPRSRSRGPWPRRRRAIGVDGHPGQGLGALDGELLDLHAALVGRHGQEGAVGAVEQVGDVVLLLDVRARVDEDAVHRVTLDVHAEDLLGVGLGVVGGLGHLDAAGLAAAADLDLRLDDGDAAEPLGDRLASSGVVATSPRRGGYAVLLEQVPWPGTRTDPLCYVRHLTVLRLTGAD